MTATSLRPATPVIAVAKTRPPFRWAWPPVLGVLAIACAPLSRQVAGFTITELVLAVSFLSCLPYAPWGSAALHRRYGVAILGFGLFSTAVVIHPHGQAVLEIVRRAFYVFGGIATGAALGRLGWNRKAAWIALSVGVAFSIDAMSLAVSSHFVPANPFHVFKNLAGGFLAGLIVMTVALKSDDLGHKKLLTLTQIILFAGLLATQSRGALVALVVAMFILILRKRLRVTPLLVVVIAALAIFLGFTIVSLQQKSQEKGATATSSIGSRLEFQRFAYNYWKDSPVFGQGIRYYLLPNFDFPVALQANAAQEHANPHNLTLESLSESGIVGFSGLVTLIAGMCWVTRREQNAWTIAGTTMLLTAVVQAQFDLFWLPGVQAMPWLVIGMGVAARSAMTDARVTQL